MTQVTVIEVTPAEKVAIEKILWMYMEDEQADCEAMEDYAQQGKMDKHIHYQLKILANMYMRLK